MLDDGSSLGLRKPVQRTSADRTAIVAETYQPGTTVAEVVRKYGIVASLISSWRTAAKRETDRDKRCGSVFVEVFAIADAQSAPFNGV